MQSEHQIPIWFFIGGTLLIYGIIIWGTGVYGLSHPSALEIHLKESTPNASWGLLHPDIWWGAVLTLLGALNLSFSSVARARLIPGARTEQRHHEQERSLVGLDFGTTVRALLVDSRATNTARRSSNIATARSPRR